MWNLMPVLGVLFSMVVIVALIYAFVNLRTVKMKAISQRSFNDFAEELRRDQREMKAALDVIGGKVASIEKMMKDVE